MINTYSATAFRERNFLANQNMRFTFIVFLVLLIAAGVVIILGELHVELVTSKFTFFYFSFMKGVIYLAIGILCLGVANILGLCIAILFFIAGIVNCVVGRNQLIHFKWNEVGQRGTTTIITRREFI